MRARELLMLGIGTVALILGSSFSQAHHSAAQFDFRNQKMVEGTVKSFDVMNPHTRATVTLQDANGTRDVDFEGHSASNFYRAGYLKGAVNPGDHIQLLIAPRKDGSDGGFIVWFKTAKGLEVGFRSLPPTGNPTDKTDK
ncbi:MAG TPA: DUF6152 family protein [Steroidobacteraceae bacterium]|nr:DUF6152 family protein [Steroidobacteraceae bacterium]